MMISKKSIFSCLITMMSTMTAAAFADEFDDISALIPFARPSVIQQSAPVDPGTTLIPDNGQPINNRPEAAQKSTAPLPDADDSADDAQAENTAVIYPVDASTVAASSSAVLKSSAQRIVVESGVNSLIPIAIGQINRIVTPFSSPTVQRLKLDTVKITVESNVLYVYTTSSQPVALFVSERGDETVALSLSLIPQKIAPVQATLVMASGQKFRNAGQAATAQRYEQKDNYAETIGKTLRSVALGEIPPGYSVQTLAQSGIPVPSCHFHTGNSQDDIRYDFSHAQVLAGNAYSVIIGTAKNQGHRTVIVDESLCRHPAMVARALWSHNVLYPGQVTEAYFMVTNREEPRPVNRRVRLAD